LEDIRSGPGRIVEQLLLDSKGSVIIVNAAAESDMYVFVGGLIQGKYSKSLALSKTKY
jgi:hypothetical protein